MDNKLGDATTIIKVLNSKTKDELEEFDIEDRTEAVLEVRNVLTKRNLMLYLEKKCQNMEVQIKKFNALHQKGLLGLQDRGGKLIPLEDYQHRLHEITVDKAKFSKIRGIKMRKTFIKDLNYDLFIQREIKHLFRTRPTFEKYTEVDESL